MAKIEFPLSTLMEHTQNRFHGVKAFMVRDLIGDTAFEAQLNSELVLLAYAQDDSIDPATIVKILRQGRSQIIDYVNQED